MFKLERNRKRLACRISQDLFFASGDEAVWVAIFRTKVTLALAMKGEMPLKRLSDDFVTLCDSLWLIVTLCDSLYTLCDSLCSSQDGHGHGLDVQIWLDDVRYLNVFSTSTWHIWHIIQCHSQYRSIVFDHSESFYFLRARGAMVFIFMQLLASILAALLALLTSGRHQNNIWDRDETILSIFLRAMYSWCHLSGMCSTYRPDQQPQHGQAMSGRELPHDVGGNGTIRRSRLASGRAVHISPLSPPSALSALFRFHVWSGSSLWPSNSLLLEIWNNYK